MTAEAGLSHPSHSYLTGLLSNVKGKHTDMILAPGVSVHRCLLGKLSPLLTSLPTFMDSSEMLTVVLPQVEVTTVEKMVELLYSGRCVVTQSETLKLQHLFNILDMSSVIQLGYKEEEGMDKDVAQTVAVEENVVYSLSEGTSEVEIRPSTFSDQEQTEIRVNGKKDRSSGPYNKNGVITFGDKSCKICCQLFVVGRGDHSGKVSRFQIARHMFSQHYSAEILNMLGVKQTSCDICDRKIFSRWKLARHMGEVHEEATKLYLQGKGSKMTVDNNSNCVSSAEVINHGVDLHLQEGILSSRRRPMECHLPVKKSGFSKKIRPRRLVRGLESREVLTKKRVVGVEVNTVAPTVQDMLKNITVDVGADGLWRRMMSTSPVRLEDPLPAHLSSRYLVHGGNSLVWRVEDDEEYSECVLDWVKTRQVRNIMKFCDLTVGEGAFFCLWNQFMLKTGFVGFVGRGHMARLVEKFVEELGRKVMEGRLYRQFVMHLGQLEREAVLSSEEVLRLVIKMQKL